MADALLSSPGPCRLAELLQVGAGHRRTDLPQNITSSHSGSWYVIVTLERQENAFFSEEQLEKKSTCIKTGILCSTQPEAAEVPHHQLVLGKSPAQKSTDPFLPAPTRLPGLPCSGRICPSTAAKPGVSPECPD